MAMIQQIGNYGVYIDGATSFTYNLRSLDVSDQLTADTAPADMGNRPQFLNMQGNMVLARGTRNNKCEEIERDIKRNRLLPSLIRKQVQLLYGKGIRIYLASDDADEHNRQWVRQPDIEAWLDSWQLNGLECSAAQFAEALIKNYYYYRDTFVRWRFSSAPGVSGAPIVAGLEVLDNKHCRLSSNRQPSDLTPPTYAEFRNVLYGDFARGAGNFKVYPRFRLADVDSYRFAAVSHHREATPGGIYGENEIYEGIRLFLKTSNEIPEYVDTFLNNSLAAKVHIDIPYSWVESKRRQLQELCKEN